MTSTNPPTTPTLAAALLSLVCLALVACGDAHPPVEFARASGQLDGVVEIRVQGVPVRLELQAVSATEGEPVEGKVKLLTPIGGAQCDLLPDDADCHALPAQPLQGSEETASHASD